MKLERPSAIEGELVARPGGILQQAFQAFQAFQSSLVATRSGSSVGREIAAPRQDSEIGATGPNLDLAPRPVMGRVGRRVAQHVAAPKTFDHSPILVRQKR